jgi:hypothetical protein
VLTEPSTAPDIDDLARRLTIDDLPRRPGESRFPRDHYEEARLAVQQRWLISSLKAFALVGQPM